MAEVAFDLCVPAGEPEWRHVMVKFIMLLPAIRGMAGCARLPGKFFSVRRGVAGRAIGVRPGRKIDRGILRRRRYGSVAFRAPDSEVAPREHELCFRMIELRNIFPGRRRVTRLAVRPEFSAVAVFVAGCTCGLKPQVRLPGVRGKRSPNVCILNVLCIVTACAAQLGMLAGQRKAGLVVVYIFRFLESNTGIDAEVFLMAGDAFPVGNAEMIPLSHIQLAPDRRMARQAFATADGLANVMALGAVFCPLKPLMSSCELTRGKLCTSVCGADEQRDSYHAYSPTAQEITSLHPKRP